MADDKHPIRNRAVAGLLVAFALWLTPRLWPQLKFLGSWLLSFFFAKSLVSNWILCLLAVLFIGLVVLIGVIVWALARPASESARGLQGPGWKSYRTDFFDGMKWNWRYDPSEGSVVTIVGLYSLCPLDLTQLVFEPSYDSVSFMCETCGRKFGPFPGDRQYVLARIERQIHRKIRTGDWERGATA